MRSCENPVESPPVILLDDETYLQSLVNKACRQIERQLDEGTASSQVLTQLLRMGDPRVRFENEKLESEISLLQEKARMIKQARDNEVEYGKVVESLQSYGAL